DVCIGGKSADPAHNGLADYRGVDRGLADRRRAVVPAEDSAGGAISTIASYKAADMDSEDRARCAIAIQQPDKTADTGRAARADDAHILQIQILDSGAVSHAEHADVSGGAGDRQISDGESSAIQRAGEEPVYRIADRLEAACAARVDVVRKTE